LSRNFHFLMNPFRNFYFSYSWAIPFQSTDHGVPSFNHFVKPLSPVSTFITLPSKHSACPTFHCNGSKTAGFEAAFLPSERPQFHALDRAATGIGYLSKITECTMKFEL
jgi:hypothetical protein